MQFSNMTFNVMFAALSVLLTRDFFKIFLRARRALEFSHGLDPQPTCSAFSFDHLVGAAEQRERECEAERLGGLEIDEQLEFDRLRNRIRAMEFLDRCCAFTAALESILLAQVPQNTFSTVSTYPDTANDAAS